MRQTLLHYGLALLISIPLLSSCALRTYHHFELTLNSTPLLANRTASSLVVQFSAGSIKDSVMIFPIDNGVIINSQPQSGTRPILFVNSAYNSYTSISVFSFEPSDKRQDYTSLLGTSESVQKISVWLDRELLYKADFTKESTKKSDVIVSNISIPKSTSELLGMIPLGFDSTQYTLSVKNNTKDSCTIVYSTPSANNLLKKLASYQTVSLYNFIHIDANQNKDIGEALQEYLPEIHIIRRDSLNQEISVYNRSMQQPIRRSEWQYSYDLSGYNLYSSPHRYLPQALYTFVIQ
jgi:hypothetical protein